MTIKTLLPSNASRLEKALSESAFDAVPLPLRDLWRPQHCPAGLLPYLAWARSVDSWSDDWQESEKRAVVASSFEVHRQKGTVGAIKRVVAALGYECKVTEWWQAGVNGRRGTFALQVFAAKAVLPETYAELERLINETKALSRHLTGINIGVQTCGAVYVHAASLLGDATTVYPYLNANVETESHIRAAVTFQAADQIVIYPKV
ncbi:phage tail protein I [Neisseria wadsworthii]|uniref:Phage tail protein I n=1 Tax=Neisseria wadsworthii 9715 TaxID=1030841 RepID=G4CPH7_9NEIS|nr:phage tail protein I [Neisseria wadsworthii]EGZ47740.1 phage tail protein I [Neisseria wadsworthii 9715]QMT34792.1 phage tail protein I [Neisseria wadsworthii]